METENLATELLHEVKASARRWFFIAMAELLVIVILVVTMLFVPVEEYSVQQDAKDTDNTQLIGGDYYGETEDNLQKEKRSGQEAP